MPEKIVIFAFQGNPTCFVHVLLNALDLKEHGHHVEIVLEGESTTLVEKLLQPANPLHQLYRKVRETGLITAVCRACATKLGALPVIEAEKLPLTGSMSGHPPMTPYLEKGFRIITL